MLNNYWTENAVFFPYNNVALLKKNALYYAEYQHDKFIFLEGFQTPYLYGCFPAMLAFGIKNELIGNVGNAFESLKSFSFEKQNPILGFLNYELKNETELLNSRHEATINFPDLYFFEPETLLLFLEDGFYFYSDTLKIESFLHILETQQFKLEQLNSDKASSSDIINKADYITDIHFLQSKIQRGDIYEVNYCKETIVKDIEISPVDFFTDLTSKSPMPFSGLVKFNANYLICASPERFLKHEKGKLISQPIKGTSRRGKTALADADLLRTLISSEKERAENIMIVDLVRNDLSHTAKDGSVHVDELCKVHSFKNIHQMISTITATQSKQFSFIDTLKHCFPMGSMTGAPKLNAMKLIDETEKTGRGLFSGSIGYIMPDTDFDFNVVIRSLIYDKSKKIASFHAGSAITIDAVAENEYEECKTKLSAINEVMNKWQSV